MSCHVMSWGRAKESNPSIDQSGPCLTIADPEPVERNIDVSILLIAVYACAFLGSTSVLRI